MPKVPVDEAPAGPAMDAAVAEALGLNVLGIAFCIPDPECSGYYLSYSGYGSVPRPVYLTECVCNFKEADDAEYFGHTAGCLEIVLEYSTDIAAVWGLVNVMREKGFVLYSLDESTGRIFERWGARFVTSDDPAGLPWEAGWHGCADTASLAICRAFLKACGVTYMEIPEQEEL